MGNAEKNKRPHVVIIGGGFGGLHAARSLAKVPVRVTVVDRRNHHLFQPLLFQVATAALSPGDIAHPIRAILGNQENATVLLGEVVGFDLTARKVRLKDGELSYDYLIVAAGCGYSYFGHEEWRQWAPSLKSIEDALEIRRRILLAFEQAERETDEERRQRLLTFVIVGGGPTGVEMAGAIAEIARQDLVREFRNIDSRSARIVLINAGPQILPSFPESLAKAAAQSLETMGVSLWLNSRVTSADSEGVVVGDQRIPAATVLWAAGVVGVPLARSLGVPLDPMGRVLVEPDLTIHGHPEVSVVGDLAAFLHQTGHPLPGVAQVAIQQGRHAAGNIGRSVAGKPMAGFVYSDPGMMATIGRASAVVDFGWIKLQGAFAWITWLFIHFLFLSGFENRAVVLFQWTWNFLTHQHGTRLITGSQENGILRPLEG